ncbi:MAG: GNAT family N-acetyltransferase [Oryzihumus sp.]
MTLHPDYRLSSEAPGLEEYRELRARAGLSVVTAEQAGPALTGSWAWVTVREAATGCLVATGRVIGDGGWYFTVADMATRPGHQGRGLGAAVLKRLLEQIAEEAPANPYVTLMADRPGRKLYARMGFVETAPHSLGMRLNRSPE